MGYVLGLGLGVVGYGLGATGYGLDFRVRFKGMLMVMVFVCVSK